MLVKSLNYWSALGGLEGTLDPAEFIRFCRSCGYEGAELAIGETGGLSLDSTEAQCRELKRVADGEGIQLQSVASGIYWSRSLGDSDQAVEDLEKMIALCAWLEAKTLLTIPGSVDVFFLPDRLPQPYDQVLGRVRNNLARVIPIAESYKVRLGIENVWNKFLLSPTELSDFIDFFGSPWLGAYVDVGNILPYGYPEQWLRILSHRVVGIHFKDFRRAVGTAEGFVDLLEGDVNWPEVMAAIREINYSGAVVAELIPRYRYCPEVRSQNALNAMNAIFNL